MYSYLEDGNDSVSKKRHMLVALVTTRSQICPRMVSLDNGLWG